MLLGPADLVLSFDTSSIAYQHDGYLLLTAAAAGPFGRAQYPHAPSPKSRADFAFIMQCGRCQPTEQRAKILSREQGGGH